MGHSLSIDLRGQWEASRASLVSGTVQWQLPLSENLSIQAGSRLYATWPDWDSLHYQLGATFTPVSFIVLETGLFHAQRFRALHATSHLWAQAKCQSPSLSIFKGFISLGWYERWTRFDKVWAIPTFQGDVHEHDFTFSLGLNAAVTPSWELSATLATWDAVEIFNLTHPFIELRSSHPFHGSASIDFYSRYQVLLGFGRLDSLAFGVILKFERI